MKRLETYVNCSGNKVVVQLFTRQVQRLLPTPCSDPVCLFEFETIMDFVFIMDDECRVKSLFVNFETGPLVLFYTGLQKAAKKNAERLRHKLKECKCD